MNTIIKTISILFAIPLLTGSSLIISMDPPKKDNNVVLFMPHPNVKSLFYLPESKCSKMKTLFPGSNITHHDPFIALVSLTVTQEQAKTINAAPQDLHIQGTAANRTLRQLSADQVQTKSPLPLKFFYSKKDGDFFDEGIMLGAGFTEYRKACTAQFTKKPLILNANQQVAREFVNAGIINRDGTHGPHSYFGPRQIDL